MKILLSLACAATAALVAGTPAATADPNDDQDFLGILHVTAVPITDSAAKTEAQQVCAEESQPDAASNQVRTNHPDWNPGEVADFVTAATTALCPPVALKVGN
ncbi:DUF732 domain-containing protein [Candidatus Mycobacterium wuenschmannii]|uniref:DUF732 domain-containing protein n=1 Tax=Candidatus Mycobacterium wuenschmannii TaxID=3027808 RepID=A0ABY8W0Q6_9MYCO|nr:DUF732 domain-containing protein [Candidatus Mycobacterium wuenschmannii]WIM88557.1 DUF732 domain-containing protein [Candidatus Mycobacterium wuenschmannii]